MKLQLALFGLLSTLAAADHPEPTGESIEFDFEAAKIDDHVMDALKCEESYCPLSFSRPTRIGHEDCKALFYGGKNAVPLSWFPDTGLIISSGNPALLKNQDSDYVGYYTNSEYAEFYGYDETKGDAYLTAQTGEQTYDACGFEMDVTCPLDSCTITAKYIFGSDHYAEDAEAGFGFEVDNFGIFLTKKDTGAYENIALVPGTSEIVSVNSVNEATNEVYYVANDPWLFGHGGDPSGPVPPYPKIEADGFTVLLPASYELLKGTYTLKIVIADVFYPDVDSWLLLPTNSICGYDTKDPPQGAIGDGDGDEAEGGGDPHFKRWGQNKRDSFHGECDLVALHAEDFHGKGLDFHVRTTIAENELFSYIESGAVRVGEDVLEMTKYSTYLNGEEIKYTQLPLTFGANNEYTLSVKKVEKRDNGSILRIVYRLNLNGDTEIEFRWFKNMMTFSVLGHADFKNGVGMLGQYPSGSMIDRQGHTMTSYEDFGFEWQVNEEDPSLFKEQRAPQLPYEKCRMPAQSIKTARRKLRGQQSGLYDEAHKACAKNTKNGHDLGLCIDDVMMTGEIGMADEW